MNTSCFISLSTLARRFGAWHSQNIPRATGFAEEISFHHLSVFCYLVMHTQYPVVSFGAPDDRRRVLRKDCSRFNPFSCRRFHFSHLGFPVGFRVLTSADGPEERRCVI